MSLMGKKYKAKTVPALKKAAFSVGDTVEIIAGGSKGKKGAVLKINKSKHQVLVEGVNIQTHFDAQKGIQKAPGPIHYSNVKFSAAKKSEGKSKKKSK